VGLKLIPKDLQLFKFSAYGFLKNQRFFDIFIFLYFLEQGISFFQIGILLSIREISILLLEIPTGIIADSFGRRRSMIFAFQSYIISFLIFYFFPRFYMYIVAMIFFALGEAFRTGTHKAMILHYLRLNGLIDKRVEYYGYTRSWSQIGSALSSLIAGFLVFYTGEYKYVFLGSIVPYILGMILMLTYPKYLDGEIHTGSVKQIINAKSFYLTLKNLKSNFKNAMLRKAIINSALFDGLFKTVKDYLQPILQSFFISLPIFLGIQKRESILIAVIYFIIYILTSISSRNSGKFKNKFNSLHKAVNYTFVTGIFFIFVSGILFVFKLHIFITIFFVLLYILQNIRRPINIGYISHKIDSKVMASGLSIESQLKTIFVAILAPIMGYLADAMNIGSAFIILSCLTLLIFPLIKVSRFGGVDSNK